jgi:uncharacterized coiled-coil DUF342 family protein
MPLASFSPTVSYAPQVINAPDTEYTVQKNALKKGESRCPIHLGVILTKKKRFSLGMYIFHSACPMCMQDQMNSVTFIEQLTVLSENYDELLAKSNSGCREIQRLQTEIESLKEDLSEGTSVDKIETTLFDRLLQKALPKIEEMMEKVDSNRTPPTPVEHIQELKDNLRELEAKVKSVAGSAKQVVADAIENVISQVNDAVNEHNQGNFGTQKEFNEFRNELDELAMNLMSVKRTMSRLPEQVSRNEAHIKMVMRNLSSFETEMEKRAEEYERRFDSIEGRLSALERNSGSTNANKHTAKCKAYEPVTVPSSQQTFSKKDPDGLEGSFIEFNRSFSTATTISCTTTDEPSVASSNHNIPSKFLEIANEVPLSTLEGDNMSNINEFLQLLGTDHVGTNLSAVAQTFLTLVSEPIPSGIDSVNTVVSTIVAVMKKGNDNVKVQLYGCVALCMCIAGDLSGCIRQTDRAKTFIITLSSLDGIMMLFGSIYNHKQSHRTTYFAFQVLGLMAFGKERVALEIVSTNGIELALGNMAEHLSVDDRTRDDLAVISSAVYFLTTLAIKNPNIRHKMNEKQVKEVADLLVQIDSLPCISALNSLIQMLERPNFWWGTVFKACFFLSKQEEN